MQTMISNRYCYKPNFEVIEEQFNICKKNDPGIEEKYHMAKQLLNEGIAAIEKVDIERALEKIAEVLKNMLNKGIDELEAAAFLYLGQIGVTVALKGGPEDLVLNSLNSAIYKTKDYLLALSAYNLFSIYYLTKNLPEKVMPYCKKTFEVTQSCPSSYEVKYCNAAANYNMAEAYYRKQEYKTGKEYAEKALVEFKELLLTNEAAKTKLLLGVFLVHLEECREGLKYLDGALKILENVSKPEEIAFLLQYKGLAKIRMEEKAEGIEYLKKALKIYVQLGKTDFVNFLMSQIASYEGK
ncbi:MAG: tetratricopeptide repeat protein [Candidatus Omnitrophota bacterium]